MTIVCFYPPPKHNVKFLYYSDTKPSNNFTNIDHILKYSKIYLLTTFLTNILQYLLLHLLPTYSVFLYNKLNSPYNFFHPPSINENNNEFVKLQLEPGKIIKIAFSNPSFYNV